MTTAPSSTTPTEPAAEPEPPHALVEQAGHILIVTLNRPKARNALSPQMTAIMRDAWDRVDSDPEIRVCILTGAEGTFCAGADLKAVPRYGPEEQRAAVAGINAMALGVYALPCPVVGAITGHAIAGGLVLALCTDVRVASAAGHYGLTEVKVGVPNAAPSVTVRADTVRK